MADNYTGNRNTDDTNSFTPDSLGRAARRVLGANTEDDPLVVQNVAVAENVDVDNVALTSANTEETYSIPNNCKQLLIRARQNNILKIAFVSGQSGTEFFTIPATANLTLSGLKLQGKSLYIQSPTAGTDVEILVYT